MPSRATYGLLAHMRTVFGVLPFICSLTVLSMSACVGDDTFTPADAGSSQDGAVASDGASDGASTADGGVVVAPPNCGGGLTVPAGTTLEIRGCAEPGESAETPINLREKKPPLEGSKAVKLTLAGTPDAAYLFDSGDVSFNALPETAAKLFPVPEHYCVSWRGQLTPASFKDKNYWNSPLFLFGKEDKGLRVLAQFTRTASTGSVNPSGVGAVFESSGATALLQSAFSEEVTVTVLRDGARGVGWFNGAPKKEVTIGAAGASPSGAAIRVGGRLPEPSGFMGNADDSNFLGSVRTIVIASPATEAECETLHMSVNQ